MTLDASKEDCKSVKAGEKVKFDADNINSQITITKLQKIK
jgi:hypothetical protein